MERKKNETFIWSVVESKFQFEAFHENSLVTIPHSDMNEEYVLLIGCNILTNNDLPQNFDAVLKFNGTWSYFGKLKKQRHFHKSIYWNERVYVIGGVHGNSDLTDSDEVSKTKMEIWKIKDSPDEFKTTENWPELQGWEHPHVFIVPDSFFPDY